MIQLTLTLKMTTAQVVETSVTVNNSPIQDYVHPDNQTQPTFETYYSPACMAVTFPFPGALKVAKGQKKRLFLKDVPLFYIELRVVDST